MSLESSSKDIKKSGYSAYQLTPTSRTVLLQKHPPRFEKIIAHHVTYRFPDTTSPPESTHVHVIGYSSTSEVHVLKDKHIECMVVQVLGTEKRLDGRLFHITLSLDPKTTRPVDSNLLLETHGWIPLDSPFDLKVDPRFILF